MLYYYVKLLMYNYVLSLSEYIKNITLLAE